VRDTADEAARRIRSILGGNRPWRYRCLTSSG
jgi:hypothetical protein